MAKTVGTSPGLQALLRALLGVDTLTNVRAVTINIGGEGPPQVHVDMWADQQQITDVILRILDDGNAVITRDLHQPVVNRTEATDA